MAFAEIADIALGDARLDFNAAHVNQPERRRARPQHDAQDFEDLMNDLGSLTDVERTGFVDHKWALVRAGRSPVSELMDLLAVLGTESDPDVLTTAARPLSTMARRLAPDLGDDIEMRLRAWIEVYYGGQIDLFSQRFLEIWAGLPTLYILIIMSSLVTPTVWWLLLIMLLFSWTQLVDVVRAEFLRGRNLDYVRAARALTG